MYLGEKMVEWRYNEGFLELHVGYHEWAWSLRTSQFPVYCIDKQGDLHYVGGTYKRPVVYCLDPDTLAVVRVYISNSGFYTFYVYEVNTDHAIAIKEEHNFQIPRLCHPAIKTALERMIAEVQKRGHLHDLITPTPPMEGEL
jgi:hypothetical protein